ncbi:hypothetical protein LZ32DRAFT_111184 [Colletotrichum eremochloae]|nr:hypothetical protein LZ32DRAFT_111184 [Colletotrichum eremochloae]
MGTAVCALVLICRLLLTLFMLMTGTSLLYRTSLHKYMREEALFSWFVRSTAASIHLVDSQFLLVRLVGLCVLMSVIHGL